MNLFMVANAILMMAASQYELWSKNNWKLSVIYASYALANLVLSLVK